MEEWKEYKLEEIGTIVGGATPSTKEPYNYDGCISWITPKDLSNHYERYISHGERMITLEGYNSCSCKMLPKGSVLFSSRAPIGFVAIAANELCTNQGFKSIIPDERLVDGTFLYYLLINNKAMIEGLGSGTTFKEVSGNVMKNVVVKIPNLEIQRRIANILSSIDDKIEVNRRINQNLESLAKQLYDYWFVQFDFPNENGKPYKSSGGQMVWNERLKRKIPEGWVASNVCKIADILSGGTPSKAVSEYWDNGYIPFFGPTDCNGYIFQIETADHITPEGLEHCASSLFEEGIIIITARGSIGKLVVVGTPMAMNQSCYALRSKTGEFEYLYFLTVQLIECLKAKGSGSVFKSIITSDIENSLLCIAETDIIARFCKSVHPIFQKIKENTIEISNLTKQRDELLPLLMNGQVSLNSDLSAR